MINDYSLFGELLYIISTFEKGRLGKFRWWSIKERNRLKHSIQIMNQIVSYLKSDNDGILRKKIFENSISYIKKYKALLISNDYDMSMFEQFNRCNSQTILQHFTFDDNRMIILNQMSKVLDRLNEMIFPRIQTKKVDAISICLFAFHNLPKALITKTGDTMLIRVNSVSVNEALRQSNIWLCKLDKITEE